MHTSFLSDTFIQIYIFPMHSSTFFIQEWFLSLMKNVKLSRGGASIISLLPHSSHFFLVSQLPKEILLGNRNVVDLAGLGSYLEAMWCQVNYATSLVGWRRLCIESEWRYGFSWSMTMYQLWQWVRCKYPDCSCDTRSVLLDRDIDTGNESLELSGLSIDKLNGRIDLF